MMTYTTSSFMTILQVTIWFLILFIWLPRKLFPTTPSKPWMYYLFDAVVRMSFVSIIVVYVLAFLNIYDFFSVAVSFVAIYLGYQIVVCKVPLKDQAQYLWKSWVITFLDILDGRAPLGPYLKKPLGRAWRNFVEGLPRGVDLWWAAGFGIVLIASGYLRLYPALQEPAPASADFYPLEIWLKGLGLNFLFPDGLYPYGSFALLQILLQFAVVDTTMLLLLTPGLVGMLLMTTIYWSVVRLTARRGPALIAATLYGIFGFAGWLPQPLPPQGEVLSVEIALVFLIPTFVFLVNALTGKESLQQNKEIQEQNKQDASAGSFAPVIPAPSGTWLFFQGMACVFFIQPFVGMLALLASIVALLAIAVLQRKPGRSVHLINRGLLATLVGVSPLLVGLAQGHRLHMGPLRWDIHFFGETIRPVNFLPTPPPTPEITWLYTLGIVSAVLLLVFSLWRSQFDQKLRTAWQLFGLVLLVFVVLFQPKTFGLEEYLLPHQIARALTPVLCVVIGLFLHWGWIVITKGVRRIAGSVPQYWPQPVTNSLTPSAKVTELVLTIAVLVALLIPFPSIFVPTPTLAISKLPKQEYESIATQLFRIKEEIPANKWTVVGYPESYSHVVGQGFFVNNQDFLESYQPEMWRFDPRRPEWAIPTPHVFILVEKHPYIVPGQTAEEAIKRDSIREQLQDWIARYQASHDDMSLFYEDGLIAVYHIYRSFEEEQRILADIDAGRLPLNIPPPAPLSQNVEQQNTLTPVAPDETTAGTTIVPTRPITYQVQRGDIINTVEFGGQIAPLIEQPMFFRTSGRVDKVNVTKGDAVTAGQVLAELETGSLERALEAARAELALIEAGKRITDDSVSIDQQLAQLDLEIAELNLQASQVGEPGPSPFDTGPELERAFLAKQPIEDKFNAIRKALETPDGKNQDLKRVWLAPWMWTVFERGTILEQATANLLDDQLFFEQAKQDKARYEIELAIAERWVEQAKIRAEALKVGSDPSLVTDVQRAQLEVNRLEADLIETEQSAPADNQNPDVIAIYAERINELDQALAEARINLKQVEANVVANEGTLSADAKQAELDLWETIIDLEMLKEQEPTLSFAEVQTKVNLERTERELAAAQTKHLEALKGGTLPKELQALQQANMDFIRARAAHERATDSVSEYEILSLERDVEQAQLNLAQFEIEAPLEFDADRERVLLNIERLENEMTKMQLVAAIDGQVQSLNLAKGRNVEAFRPVGRIIDPGAFLVIADQVTPQVLERLVEDLPVTVTLLLGEAGQEGITGYIQRLPVPTVESSVTEGAGERTVDNIVRVALDVPTPGAGYQLGDRVQVAAVLDLSENVLLLPWEAIRTNEDGESFVAVQKGDAVQEVKVELGLESPDYVEIKGGLPEGQIVLGQ